MWFLEDISRFQEEKQAIAELTKNSDWLKSSVWDFQDGKLWVVCNLIVDGVKYEIKLLYPKHFPDIAPIVMPKDEKSIWSSHQYVNSVLCLEWGADNWNTQVTGAQLIESAYSLLNIEKPHRKEKVVAPSRHELSIGQELRTKSFRLFISDTMRACLDAWVAKDKDAIKFEVGIKWSRTAIVYALVKLTNSDGTEFQDAVTPREVFSLFYTGTYLSLRESPDIFNHLNSLSEIEALKPYLKASSKEREDCYFLIEDSENNLHFIIQTKDGKLTHILDTQILSSAYSKQRIPKIYKNLDNQKIGIVGLGSVGSKVAVALARTGINNFVLVDHDMWMPENVSRNDLDWTHLAEHKVDAISNKLRVISKTVNVETIQAHLTGQESASYIDNAISSLASCSIIIDATATQQVHSLVGNIARREKIPFIWMEVYGGGIGGMIARSRPNLDPSPLIMQRMYEEEILSELDLPEVGSANYAAATATGQIMTASDADVGVIANYSTMFILDTLGNAESSEFDHSMYLIGLRKTSFFKSPFDVRPVITANLGDEDHLVSEPEITEDWSEEFEFLSNLIKKDNAGKDT